MNIYQVILISIIGASASLILKKTNPEISMIIGIATGLIIMYFTLNGAAMVLYAVNDVVDKTGVEMGYIWLIIKIVGITYIGEFAVSALNDAGESGIASKVEVFAKIIIIGMAAPVFTEFLNTALGLLK